MLYFSKHQDGAITFSNWPLKEVGAESYEFEVLDEDYLAVQEGSKDWLIIDGQLSIIPSTRKADAEAAQLVAEQVTQAIRIKKFDLIKKVTAGTATLEEQQELANLL